MREKPEIKLVSSDLNGTLVPQHTMSDMIRICLGGTKFKQANKVFKRQTDGEADMEEAFGTAGPLTKGITLRQAVDYTRNHMGFVNGFDEFVNYLHSGEIPLVINSTGYSVTIHAIREQIGRDKIHGQIGNRLVFGLDGDPASSLRDDELERLVRSFFVDSNNAKFDRIQAVGKVELDLKDEAAKAQLINEYCTRNFSGVRPTEIIHIGDTYGDSEGILRIAKQGGVGVAFNYNPKLEQFLKSRDHGPGRVHYIDPKGPNSDLRNIIPLLE